MIGVMLSIIVTVALWAVFAASLILPSRAMNEYEQPHPVRAIFGWSSYVLGGFAIAFALTVVVWSTVGGVAHEHANVGDVRCQRYIAYFNGKTESERWQTVDCVQVNR